MATRSRQQRLVVASHRRPSAARMRDWRVGLKLAAVLAIPLVSFLVIAGVQVGTSIASASTLDGFAKRVALGNQITNLVHELQRERDRTAGMLASLTSATSPTRDTGVLSPDWTAVDRAIQQMRTTIEPLLGDPVLAEGYSKADSLLGQLPTIREGTAQGWLRARAAFDTYTAAIGSLLNLLPVPLEVGGDTAVARSVRGFTNLSLAKELTAQIRGHLYMVCSAGAFGPGEFDKIADVRAQAQSALDRFRADANAAQVTALDEVVTGQAVSNASRLLQTIVANARGAELGVEAEQWWLASTTQLELMRAVERGLQAEASAGVLAASSSQWQATLFGSLAVLALLAIAVFTSIVIGRFMASALRSLREQAMHVAQRTLPGIIEQLRHSPTTVSLRIDPVVVNSRDEVGEVAVAFTAVHRSAVRLAAEQATMRRNVNDIFIKLARRSQALVERQLKLLDTMESKETDPAQLANLFRLDHLATRLRRNDENLLVLAEGDSTRHWDQPVDVGTVVTAATAEIEHYTRVRNEITETTYIVGYVVTDLVHLIAELLENATMFSPPTTQVTITADTATTSGGVELLIADEGIGMSLEAIAEANEQLAMPVAIDVSAAERMGLVVVGHLAQRHGIQVRLKSAYPGTKVLVTLPATVVSEPPPVDEADFSEPARWLRAEDVLRPHRSNTRDSVWWTKDVAQRNGSTNAHTPGHAASTTPSLTSSGLPKRTRTNKRITIEVIEPVYTPAAAEIDPEQTGSMLTSFLSGVRRADNETPEG